MSGRTALLRMLMWLVVAACWVTVFSIAVGPRQLWVKVAGVVFVLAVIYGLFLPTFRVLMWREYEKEAKRET